jgi:hypothetical protein
MKFLEICFIIHLEGEDTSLAIKTKNLKCIFLPQNKHLKPKIDCKSIGKWKHQICFFFSELWFCIYKPIKKIGQIWSLAFALFKRVEKCNVAFPFVLYLHLYPLTHIHTHTHKHTHTCTQTNTCTHLDALFILVIWKGCQIQQKIKRQI